MMNNRLDKITGPVIPLPVPFNEDESVAYDELSRYVSFLVDNGVETVMTTVGTSRYNLLSWDECKKVNESVVKACAGKCKSIVANPPTGSTQHAIEFAQHAMEIGADFFLVYFPERDYGDEHTLPFFEKLHAATDIDILLHEMPRRNGTGPGTKQYGLELLTKLLSFERIVGLKEEALDPEYSNMLLDNLADKAIIIGAGGGMSRYYYRDFERGAMAYLGGLGNFFPQIELDFFRYLQNGQKEEARKIVEDIELKYFEKVSPIGWHPHLKSALNLMGLMPGWERSPMKQLKQEEIELIDQVLIQNQWKK
ncbi:dihydrodipicolinate synthase family protein [Salibacteraceae bacterium]|nr:dihydrodipicolinate synthase family protein [Salibacteraceae bacterium]